MAAPIYHNIQMPPDISRGAQWGPAFSTIVVVGAAGTEQRIANWSQSRYKGDVSHGLRTPAQMDALIAFFQARQGKTHGFRFKDWSDYTATNEVLALTGTPTFQLTKTYTSGGVSRVRNIYAPVVSPAVTLRKNTASFTAFTLVTTTGVVTLTTPIITKAITAITKASSAVMTVGAAHGFATNDIVYISGVAGMTEINGLVGTVTATGGTTITISVNSTNFSTYTSGGVADKYMTTTDVFDWSGQFDCVVRFDVDSMQVEMEDSFIRSWSSVPIVELRGT